MSIPQILLPIEAHRGSYSILLKIYVSPGSAAAVRAAVVAIRRHGLDSIDGKLFNMRNGYKSIGDLIVDIRNDALGAADPEAAVKDDPRFGTDILETIWGDESVLKTLLSRLPIQLLLEFRTACEKVRGMLDSSDGASGILLPVYSSVFKKLLRDPPEIPDPFALNINDPIRLQYHHAAAIIVDSYEIPARDPAGDSIHEAVARGCGILKGLAKAARSCSDGINSGVVIPAFVLEAPEWTRSAKEWVVQNFRLCFISHLYALSLNDQIYLKTTLYCLSEGRTPLLDSPSLSDSRDLYDCPLSPPAMRLYIATHGLDEVFKAMAGSQRTPGALLQNITDTWMMDSLGVSIESILLKDFEQWYEGLQLDPVVVSIPPQGTQAYSQVLWRVNYW